ncbi:MAG: FixH family protein [Proteobacteria bacterium]|nr:FixH family protein [Pseudomonadota bacterium]
MTSVTWRKGALAVSVVLLANLSGGAGVMAAPQDYRFEIVDPPVRIGKDAAIGVRLVHAPSGRPIADAVIIQSRVEMPMGSAPAMVAKTTAVQPDGKGVYRLMGEVTMEGDWSLNLAAKVQGEAETIRATLRFKAVK